MATADTTFTNTSGVDPTAQQDQARQLVQMLAQMRAQAPAAFRYGRLQGADVGDAAKNPTASLQTGTGLHNDLFGLNTPEQHQLTPQETQAYEKSIAPFEAYEQRVYGAKNNFPLILAILGGALGPMFGPMLGGALGLGSGLAGTAVGDALMGGLTSTISGGNPLMGALGGGLGALGGAGIGSLLHGLGGAAGGAAGALGNGASLVGSDAGDVLDAAGNVASTLSPVAITAGLSGGASTLGEIGAGLGSTLSGFGSPGTVGNNPDQSAYTTPYGTQGGGTGTAISTSGGFGLPGAIPSASGNNSSTDNTLSPLTVTANPYPTISPLNLLTNFPQFSNTPADIHAPPAPPPKNLGSKIINSIGGLNPQDFPAVFPGHFPIPGVVPPLGGSGAPNPFNSLPPSDLGPGGSPGAPGGTPGSTPGSPGSTPGPVATPAPTGGVGGLGGGSHGSITGSPFGGGGAGAGGLGGINIQGSAAPNIYPWNTLTGGGL